ncbi:MAG: lipase maturation factor family protein [Gammaproteobacteria bacterium]|jgi:hypothetical protein
MQQENTYELVSALFIKLLALVYFIAFASLSSQIVALAGQDGILPLTHLLENATTEFGWKRYLAFPTVFWINAGDTALTAATWLGCAFSVLLLLNYKTRFSLIALYLLYLSLYHAGQTFMNFQWDYLLIEAGFLAIFLTPNSRIIIFLFRWLLFRLRFMSGLSKILSNDPGWAGLSALTFYFETQPLPHVGAWYAHQLPEWILILATAATLFIELVVPFMMFMARRYRFIAAWLTLLLQVLIILTSNHNWFNILTIILCLFLFDDKAIARVIPDRLCNWLLQQKQVTSIPAYSRPVSYVFAAIILVTSSVQLWEMASGSRIRGNAGHVLDYIERWSLANNYHVFPTVNQQRVELIIEGTADGHTWLPYSFKYKPGALNKPLYVVIPHQPRLDWMVWFVPLHPVFTDWFENFLDALLDNSPSVIAMLEHNPFPAAPPVAIRVRAYEYKFTDIDEHNTTGNWWKRHYLGPFEPLPVVYR